MISLNMCDLKYGTNELIYKTEANPQAQRTDWLSRGKAGVDWKSGVSRCKLLYIGWINNKVLPQRTANYVQYPLIKRNGKEHEKQCIYISITDSLCCTTEVNRPL